MPRTNGRRTGVRAASVLFCNFEYQETGAVGQPLGLGESRGKKGGFGRVGRERLDRGQGAQFKSFSLPSHHSPTSLILSPTPHPPCLLPPATPVCIHISYSLCSSNPSSLYLTPVCRSPILSPRPSCCPVGVRAGPHAGRLGHVRAATAQPGPAGDAARGGRPATRLPDPGGAVPRDAPGCGAVRGAHPPRPHSARRARARPTSGLSRPPDLGCAGETGAAGGDTKSLLFPSAPASVMNALQAGREGARAVPYLSRGGKGAGWGPESRDPRHGEGDAHTHR